MYLTQQKGKEELPFLQKLSQRHTGADRLVRPERQPGHPAPVLAQGRGVRLHRDPSRSQHDRLRVQVPAGAVPQPNQIGYGNFAFESDDARRLGMVKWGFMRFKHGPTGGPPKKVNSEPKKDTVPPPVRQK